MYDLVHVDEKWFYIMNDGTGVLPTPCIEVQNKYFFSKYMFLVSVAWLWKFCNGMWFDGKTGTWPIVDIVLVKRDSKKIQEGNPDHETSHGQWGEVQEGRD
ncbi:unnamed protein product [Discosporangium mesarthrocarpum]